MQKHTSTNSTVVNKNRWCRKITEEHEPFIFELRAKGSSYRAIAELLEKEHHLKVDHVSIFHYFKNRLDGYEKYLSDLKEVRLANAKARIFDLEKIADKLKEKVFEIMEDHPRQWQELNLASLIKEFKGLLAQIQDESGDKVHKFKGEGMGGDFHQHNYFGDETVNKFADQAIQARTKEVSDSGNRLKADRFSDPGNSLSDN